MSKKSSGKKTPAPARSGAECGHGAPKNGPTLDVSVVIPVYNEEDGLAVCQKAVVEVMDASGYDYEIVYVDDGSRDRSWELIKGYADAHPRVRAVRLYRNCGQQKALLVGLDHSRGKCVITYDSDLQFAPSCLPDLTREILAGAEVASGIRAERKDPLFYNRIPSAMGRMLINKALEIEQTDFGAVKAYSWAIVQEILGMGDRFTVIPAAAMSISKKYKEIPVEHRAREIGTSKWSILKRVETYFDVYVSYANHPFQSMMILGFMSMFLSGLMGVGILLYKLLSGSTFAGTIIFFDVFLFFFGLQFMALSFVGEFVVRIFRNTRWVCDDYVAEVADARELE